jgi:NitT/TauT family transport system permease protein
LAHGIARERPAIRQALHLPSPRGDWLALPTGVLLLALAWFAAARAINAPYLLPTPTAVLSSLFDNRSLIAWHAAATVVEIACGFGIGCLLATTLGYVISRSAALDRLIMPYLVASQAVPIVAIAPLLVFWFGSGMSVKIAAAALIVFFPMLVSTIVGLRNIDPTYRELMHALSATRRQTLVHLEIPAALPVLLGGLKVGVTLSVIGAVVGEFLGSDRGLGTLVDVARGQFNNALMFAGLLTLVALALGLYGLATLAERMVLRGR